LCPECLIKVGTPRTFADEFIRANGNYKKIPKGTRFLQVKHVTRMNQIENTMRLDNAFSIGP
jgi:hypothetical protein